MLTDSIAPQHGSLVDAAKERIQPGPLPDWVVPCTFPRDFRAQPPGQLTYLLWDKQLHAEKYQEYTHVAVRLETLDAVQSQSEWRIDCHPRHQKITVHWIKLHRGEQEFDQTRLADLRPASGAPADRQTLALLLEDVRMGDILEWCYTAEDRPVLMAEHCACFFAMPDVPSLGKLFVAVRFNASRRLKWKSSARDLAPAEAQGKDEVQWVWARENFAGPVPEENTPEWRIPYPWIQVSDCTDWAAVATEFAAAWNVAQDQAAAREFSPASPGQDAVFEQAEKAINLVQDEFRCLPDDAELDAEPPGTPEIVTRRRFGNSKDLSFLLVQRLRELGLNARLILVNTKFGKSLRDLLPAPGLFDHVVVEVEARGERRWIDATAKGQGGGLLTRVIRDYGLGLPVKRGSSGLVPTPIASISYSAYEIKESILLDTSGEPSLLGVVVTARGSYAEDFRRDFGSLGCEAVARRRLQMCIDRFGSAARLGTLNYRDDRKANEFFLAEIFEIKDFMEADAKGGSYKLNVTDEVLTGLLKLPGANPRQAPFALTYPCDASHTFEVYCVALAPGSAPDRAIDNPWLQFTWGRKMLAGNWIVRSSLWTLADAIPPEGLEEYQESVEEIRTQSAWTLEVPSGLARPHQRSDFGTLPALWESMGATRRVPMKAPVDIPRDLGGAIAPAASPTEKTGEVRYKRKKRHRRRRRDHKSTMFWGVCLAGVLLALLVLLIIELARGAERALPPPVQAPDGGTPPASSS